MIHFPLSGTVDGASKVVALHVMLTLTKRKQNMGVSKNRGTPKWMVYNGKPLLKWMIWGENPLFTETSI